MECRESTRSPRPRKDGTIERTWIVIGTIDDQQAEVEAYARAPTSYRGMIRSALPDTDPVARGIYEVTFTYEPADSGDNEQTSDEPKGDEPTLGTLEFDGSGGTEHVTQCISQKAYPAGGAAIPQEVVDRKIVGLHKDGVNGVDVDVPGTMILLTKKWLPQAVTGDYLKGLLDFRGHTNKAPWTLKWGFRGNKYEIEFPTGELRFLYAKVSTSFTRRGVGVFEITYAIMHSKNRENIILADGSAGIIIPKKNGHDYLWCFYQKETLTGNLKVTVEVPKVAFCSVLYEEDDFKTVLKF